MDDLEDFMPAAAPSAEDLAAEQLHDWQQQRLRSTPPVGSLFSGFGPNGQHSLYLPSDAEQTVAVIRDGRVVAQTRQGAAADPELMAIRARLIMGLKRVDTCVFEAPKELVEYAIRLLQVNYAFTDEELNKMLLSGSTKWADAVIRHALGGRNAIAALQHTGELASMLLSLAQEQQRAAQLAQPAPRRFAWFKAFFKRD